MQSQSRERSLGWSVDDRGDVHFLDKKWTILGLVILAFLVFEMIVAVAEFILAAQFEHGYGVLVALLAYALALAGLIAILNSNFFAKSKRWWRLPVWIPNIILFVYLIVLLSIRWATPDHPVNSFPASCRVTTDCCRLTSDVATNVDAQGLQVPVIAATLDTVESIITNWAGQYANVGFIRQAYNGTFYQMRFVSNAFGFPSDFYVLAACVDNSAVLSIQSESRLGKSDAGGNRHRVEDFLWFIAHTTFNPGLCL